MNLREDIATRDKSAAFLISEFRSVRQDVSLQCVTFRILAVSCSLFCLVLGSGSSRQLTLLVIALAVSIVWFAKAGVSERKANRLETLIIDSVLGDEGGESAKTLARWDFTEWKEPAWVSSRWEPFFWLAINLVVSQFLLV